MSWLVAKRSQVHECQENWWKTIVETIEINIMSLRHNFRRLQQYPIVLVLLKSICYLQAILAPNVGCIINFGRADFFYKWIDPFITRRQKLALDNFLETSFVIEPSLEGIGKMLLPSNIKKDDVWLRYHV